MTLAGPVRRNIMSQQERGVRLQKVLAARGLGSRRECETWIVEGRVQVNGRVANQLGTRVDPERDEIRVDGEVLRAPARRRYYLVNKPPGVVCTHRDPQRRLRLVDLVPDGSRLFPVGRLDRSSEGLILLTDDGDFANRLAHPRYGVPKTYRVRVAGHPTVVELQKLRKGVYLAEGRARVDSIRIRRRYRQSTELEVVLKEGKNREIRRILARIGHKVVQLKRIAIGPLRLGSDIPSGAYRELRGAEIKRLLQAADPSRADRRSSGRRTAAGTGKRRRGRVQRSDPRPARSGGVVLNLVDDGTID